MNKCLIKSNNLEKLQTVLHKVAEAIKEAIKEKRPILIRHHADTDGYAGAIALQQAIMPLLYKAHARERDMQHYYTRLPSLTPYYDNQDALRDVTNFLIDKKQFQHKEPLIIICDIGTTKQSITGIKLAKNYDAKIIVIDHHPPDKEIQEVADILLNPHLIKSDYDFCTGMMCAEIANIINQDIEALYFIAAVAGYADKVKSEEYMQYLELCKDKGITEDDISTAAICIDYFGYELGNKESNDMLVDLFNPDSANHKQLIKLFSDSINEKMKKQLESNLFYAKITHLQNTMLSKIYVELDLEKIKKGNEYPRRGKCVGMMQDYMQRTNKVPVITIGYSKDAITFRSSTEIQEFSIDEIIKLLQQKLPGAQVDGGGHRVAGSISFIPQAFDDVKKIVDEYVEKILK
ncbi:DHH family phosphoesterase [Candidatus Woesearchaeota archaeon]|nr:DHH family phosphoesterase [Candidatus Woesearchaeota archaeon]